jgi:hypothetical protein
MNYALILRSPSINLIYYIVSKQMVPEEGSGDEDGDSQNFKTSTRRNFDFN